MKTTPVFAVLVLLILLIACKKTKPEPMPEPQLPVAGTELQVKINGTDFAYYTKRNEYQFSQRTVMYINGGSNGRQVWFQFYKYPKKDSTYTLGSWFGDTQMMYWHYGFMHKPSTGNIKINEIDTSANGVISKLNATFQFKTDTANDQWFELANGTVNF